MMRFFRDLFGGMDEDQGTYLIAGLGNPGRQYKNTRHNVGFMLMDRLAGRLEVDFTRMELKALVTRTKYREKRLILAKPQTFMNSSGGAVGSLLRYYKVPLANLLVAYDEVDLDLGTLRLRPDGGAGGHKGMASIIKNLGTQEFSRLRLGIGRPPGRKAAADYVLRDFTQTEREIQSEVLDRAVDAVLAFVLEGVDAAMNRYNGSIEDL